MATEPPLPSRVSVGLFVLLAVVGLLSVAAIALVRRGALAAEREERAMRTVADARTIEAALATLAGELRFLGRTLADLLDEPATMDPAFLRFRRLEAEGTLLQFVEDHPAIERVHVVDEAGQHRLGVGRRGGAPVLESADASKPPTPDLFVSRWPIGPGVVPLGWLEVLASRSGIVRAALPDRDGELDLVEQTELTGTASAIVVSQDWSPPLGWRVLERRRSSRVESTLAGRDRWLIGLVLAIVGTTLGLAFLALREERRAGALAADAEHQARLREVERQLFHGERLASVGRLAAGVAHEINNPLEGMTNYLRLLREELDSGNVDEARPLAARVDEGLARVATIVRRLLALADPAKQPKRRLDLGEVARETAAFVRDTPGFRAIDLAVEIPDSPLAIDGDRATLGQLFLNLLLNAREAQNGIGRIELELAHSERGGVVATVRDHGPGFAAEILERLFEPFVSTRGSTGLGLAICRGIVLDHGGEISATNAAGGGALIEIHLPSSRQGETS